MCCCGGEFLFLHVGESRGHLASIVNMGVGKINVDPWSGLMQFVSDEIIFTAATVVCR